MSDRILQTVKSIGYIVGTSKVNTVHFHLSMSMSLKILKAASTPLHRSLVRKTSMCIRFKGIACVLMLTRLRRRCLTTPGLVLHIALLTAANQSLKSLLTMRYVKSQGSHHCALGTTTNAAVNHLVSVGKLSRTLI